MSNVRFTDYISKEEGLSLDFENVKLDIDVFSLSSSNKPFDVEKLALHLRQQYATDELIKTKSSIIGVSEEEYVNVYLLPNPKGSAPSPSTASGEFGEIVCSDVLEKYYLYIVPRLKLMSKQSPSNSVLLTDILAYKNGITPEQDVLCLAEVKTNLSGDISSTLAKAFEEVSKKGEKARDKVRIIKTIEMYMQNAAIVKDTVTEKKMERFAKKTESNYLIEYFACSVLQSNERPEAKSFGISLGDCNDGIKMFHVYGPDLKELENNLFGWFKHDNRE